MNKNTCTFTIPSITTDEGHNVIKSFNDSCPGHDNIQISLPRESHRSILKPLIHLVNLLFDYVVLLKQLKMPKNLFINQGISRKLILLTNLYVIAQR